MSTSVSKVQYYNSKDCYNEIMYVETEQNCVTHTHGGGIVSESSWLMKLVPLLRSFSFSGERLETHTVPPTVGRPVCCSVNINVPPTLGMEA